LNKKSLILLTILLTFLTGWADDTEHTVKRGDTLWDISKEYYNDYWKWPVIWKYNVKINNPDRIYPKEKFIIPYMNPNGESIKLSPNSKSFKLGGSSLSGNIENQNKNAGLIDEGSSLEDNAFESPTVAGAANLGSINDFEIVQYSKLNKTITDTESSKFFVSNGDLFVSDAGLNSGLKQGDTIVIYEQLSQLSDNVYLYKVAGYGTAVNVEESYSRISVTKAFEPISKGFFIEKHDEYKVAVPQSYKRILSDISGKVQYIANNLRMSGQGDRIIIDIGSSVGIKTGDIFSILRITSSDQGIKKQENIAEAQIIYTSKHHSTLKILSSDIEVKKADTVFLTKVGIY
jgi:hypothetical protein